MKRIPLTPYPGEVVVTSDRKEHARLYRRLFGNALTARFKDGLTTHIPGEPLFLVYARNIPALAHELSHVILDLFKHIGSDPREGDGEPFAYLMSHLMEQSTRKKKPAK